LSIAIIVSVLVIEDKDGASREQKKFASYAEAKPVFAFLVAKIVQIEDITK